MAQRRVTHVLCAADPRGSAEAIEQLGQAADRHDADVIAMVGDLAGDAGGQEAYRRVFQALGRLGLPTYWTPGPADAPIADYLREAHNIEVVFGFLHGVHGTAAYTPDGHVVVAGHGGEVSDDPDAERDELSALRYPRWEPEYRLKIIGELDEHQIMLLFSTPLAHKGLAKDGSEALAELAATYRARLVVCGGRRNSMMIGRTLVVAPGSLADGHYAIADLHNHEVEMAELATA